MTPKLAIKLLDFWFGDAREGPEQAEARLPVWFESSDAFDESLRTEFGAVAKRVQAGELDDWADTPQGRLALIIALEQLSRNLYRRTPEAFAHDGKALALCLEGLDLEHDKALHPVERLFFYLPLEHAEDMDVQDESSRRYARLSQEAAGFESIMKASVDAVEEHRDLIRRFGRFPHRNEILGRESTQAELDSSLPAPAPSGNSPRSTAQAHPCPPVRFDLTADVVRDSTPPGDPAPTSMERPA